VTIGDGISIVEVGNGVSVNVEVDVFLGIGGAGVAQADKMAINITVNNFFMKVSCNPLGDRLVGTMIARLTFSVHPIPREVRQIEGGDYSKYSFPNSLWVDPPTKIAP